MATPFLLFYIPRGPNGRDRNTASIKQTLPAFVPEMSYENLGIVKEGIKERISEENKVNRAKKQSIQAQIQSLKGKESKLLDMCLAGKCTQAMYDAKTAEFKEQIKELEDRLELSPEVGKEAVSAMNAILQVVSVAREIMNSSVNSKKCEFLRLILSNCVLTDKSACFYLKKPFDSLLKSNGYLTWLRCINIVRTRDILDLLSLGKSIEKILQRYPV